VIEKIQTTKQGFHATMPHTIYAGSVAFHATVFDRVQVKIELPTIAKEEKPKFVRKGEKRRPYQPRVFKTCECGAIFKTTVGQQERYSCSKSCGQARRTANRARAV